MGHFDLAVSAPLSPGLRGTLARAARGVSRLQSRRALRALPRRRPRRAPPTADSVRRAVKMARSEPREVAGHSGQLAAQSHRILLLPGSFISRFAQGELSNLVFGSFFSYLNGS